MNRGPTSDDMVHASGGFESSDYVGLFFELFEHSTDAVWIARLEDGVLYAANAAFRTLFGLSLSESIGRSTIDLGLWADTSDRNTLVGELRRRGRVDRYVVQMRTAASAEFPLSVSVAKMRWRGEDVILGIGSRLR